MSICVISDVGGDTVTIDASGRRMTLPLPEAYALFYHLQFTLQQLAHDQVVRDRERLVQKAYSHE